jgi:hypothetical protein
VGDYFIQGRGGWVRLLKKAARNTKRPVWRSLETYLDEYLAAAGISRSAS